MAPANYTVGDVASLARVSVRTLHHYDAIGLLVPSGRTTGGYRSYSVQNVQRLQQILFYRALEFGLDDIAAMLADSGASADDHLRRQHRLLREQIEHRRDLLAAIEKEMEARAMGISLTPEEQFEIFGSDRFTGEYAAEAEERWGETEAWTQSQTRTAALTKPDWLDIKAATEANEAAFADAMRAGEAVDSAHVQELVDAHRAGVCRFWDCSPEAHKNLADMYLADDRFHKHYDDVAPGLAEYVNRAIHASGH